MGTEFHLRGSITLVVSEFQCINLSEKIHFVHVQAERGRCNHTFILRWNISGRSCSAD